MPTADRRTDLDRAKGLGILLVVLGHIVARDPPLGNDWYMVLKAGIYEFHMPFFLYLSGYVTFLSGAARVAPALWPRLVARRALRLLLPFAVFGFVLVGGKLLAAHVLYVDNVPASAGAALVDLLWTTDRSPAVSVWYMFVLFIACVATPPLLWIARGRSSLVLVLALLAYGVGFPHRLYADRIAGYFVFFVLGGMAAEAGDRWLQWLDRYRVAAQVSFAVAVVAGVAFSGHIDRQWALLVCGCLSMPALHGLIRRVPATERWLLVLGAYSFVIYLLNTLCIGLAKGLLLKLLPWDGSNFLVFAPALLLAGLAGPMLVKRYLFRAVPALDRITA